MLRIAFALLLGLHGLIHLLGPASAVGWVAASPRRSSIGSPAAALSLAAAVLLVVAGVALALGAPWWWCPALPGVLLSQVLIGQAWQDARFGTLANLVIAVPLVLAAADAARRASAPASRATAPSSSRYR
jgi:uncharacterized membrane protein YphA (DoxX/SURF4 family)